LDINWLFKKTQSLEKIHDNNIIYHNISPQNICISYDIQCQKLFFINFQNSFKKKILDEDNFKSNTNLFSSLNNHLGIYPSYRDDMESMVYLLLYFILNEKFLESLNSE